MKFPRYASLDVGSNTVRLLLAEMRDGEMKPLLVERRITRLGGGLSEEGGLAPQAEERTLRVVAELAELARGKGAEAIFAVGTGVLRRASNGNEFLRRVRREAGVPLRLISGEEEARLMLKGVLSYLREGEGPPRLVADVGGWSTELLWVENGVPRLVRSAELGAVALCEKFLLSDPPRGSELERLNEHISAALKGLREDFLRAGLQTERLRPELIGTAGTVTTLAAIDQGLAAYDAGKISGHDLSREKVEEIYLRLRALPLRERRSVPGLEEGREDLIVAGAAVVLGILKTFGLHGLIAVDAGLLEGVLLEGARRMKDEG